MQQQQTITRRKRSPSAAISASLLLLFCLVCARPSSAKGSGVDAMCMVQEHNALRAEIGAPKLRWSKPLARQAATWATTLKKSGCAMRHSRGKLGENLYWASARITTAKNKTRSAPQAITEKDVAAAWASEKAWYSRASNSCNAPPGKSCGHYTQMVWAKTKEIGCAKAVCDDNSQIWVCNYAPAGNFVGQRPY